ncbi:MAG: type VI secretion system tube protein Hcp, partial [Desulfobacteraceae bacterium]|nr:type VI secretion system tube protein Hcp [Desulfobacteraceae bacterium]
MAYDAFIKIDGIDGESTDDKHHGWIEIIRHGMGVKQTVSTTASSAGGASAERADFSDFSIRKYLDKSSPKL